MRVKLCFASVMLLCFALQDLRSGSISVFAAGLFAAAELILAAVLFIISHDHVDPAGLLSAAAAAVPETAAALLPGGILLLISIATRGGIGTGDAVIAFLLGLCLPAVFVTSILLCGLIFSAMYSALMLMTGRKRLRASFPFIPFLLPGLLAALLLHPV